MNHATVGSLPLFLALVGCVEYGIGEGPQPWGDSLIKPPEAVTHTDSIVQVLTPQVDILWTIDNSCSMSDEQEKLGKSFPVFMGYFLGSGLDYHIGVTSTDIDNTYNGSKGTLKTASGYLYIDEETPNPTDVFVAMATLGIGGSGNEKGFGGTYLALEEKRDTANAGFYRDDASIHTVVITDEPDSTQASVITQAEFEDWYDGLKVDSDDRTFNCIVDMNTGAKYVNSARKLDGLVMDGPGNDDWGRILEELGLQASGYKREYFLSRLPAADTIEVTILTPEGYEQRFDEAELDPATGEPLDLDGDGEADGEWTYDPGRNSITFIDHVPEPLSTIRITYTLLDSKTSSGDSFGGE